MAEPEALEAYTILCGRIEDPALVAKGVLFAAKVFKDVADTSNGFGRCSSSAMRVAAAALGRGIW